LEEGFAFSQALIHQGISSLGFLNLWDQEILYVSLRVTRKVWVTRDLFCGRLCEGGLDTQSFVSFCLLEDALFKGALSEGAGARRATEEVNK